MFKIYSKGCEYVLRALTTLPADHFDVPFLAKDLCRKARVPEASTRKAFQKLAKEGILTAMTGPGGGYRLAVAPADISLLSIITAIEGEDVFKKCILGLRVCSDRKPCPVHASWKKLRGGMMQEMESKNLAQLMRAVK
ncbi:MAG: Rrf2 family transcriptional regulator [Candidatus Omnitrophica bacterium]|nr:Rrf2 family transcriptional regulator [Candidatus Omnitrophota bacterium]